MFLDADRILDIFREGFRYIQIIQPSFGISVHRRNSDRHWYNIICLAILCITWKSSWICKFDIQVIGAHCAHWVHTVHTVHTKQPQPHDVQGMPSPEVHTLSKFHLYGHTRLYLSQCSITIRVAMGWIGWIPAPWVVRRGGLKRLIHTFFQWVGAMGRRSMCWIPNKWSAPPSCT